MGLVSKLKNILFEEEEVEIPVLEKKEKKASSDISYKEMPKKPEIKSTPDYSSFYEEEEEPLKPEKVVEERPRPLMEEKKNYKEEVSEREIFKSEKTFQFPNFDEEEFESALPRRTTNVLEHERKKESKKKDYQAPVKREESPDTKPKFRPSPIISPVYGILDKNYTPDEITTRETENPSRSLDVDSVRKKAFGSLEEAKPKKVMNEEPEDKILEEKLEKARTIDELLKDSSDCEIDIENSTPNEDKLPEAIESLEDIEPKHEENAEEDTLENDLFDLIDSMYENREDGE